MSGSAIRRLAGKVALVTGGGAGLGHAIVARFLEEGASVVVLERSAPAVEALRQAFNGLPLAAIVGDVRLPEDNERAVACACETFGRLDTFIGNAGVYDNRARLADISLNHLGAAYAELFAVNVQGYLLGARASLDALQRSRGSMIFTASVSSHTAGYGGVLYVASKHAVAGIVRQLAWELAPDGVRVNGIAPGYVPTRLSGLDTLGQATSSAGLDASRLPLGAVCLPSDHAALYALLASDDGCIASGSVFNVDGGLAVAGPAFKGWST